LALTRLHCRRSIFPIRFNDLRDPRDLIPPATWTLTTISTEDREFFIELGERIAALRKAHNVTQVQLAEALGVSHQTFQAYEVGRRRIPVPALPVVARLLEVSLDELFGTGKPAARGKRGPASQLERSIERIG
jgi:DNA-binding XRE family transcriptional regulator